MLLIVALDVHVNFSKFVPELLTVNGIVLDFTCFLFTYNVANKDLIIMHGSSSS